MMRSVAALLLLLTTAVCAEEQHLYSYVSADRIEYQADVERTVWDLQGWYGGDTHKLRWKFEGSDGTETENELQLLYSRAIAPFFDAQFGVRVTDGPGGTDSALLAGIQGLAPYNIEVDIAASVDTDGDFELHGELEHDVRFSQRVVLQPRLELRAASADADQVAFELRLRYEFSRRMAPYVGVSWQRHFDDAMPDDTSTVFVAGLRFWF